MSNLSFKQERHYVRLIYRNRNVRKQTSLLTRENVSSRYQNRNRYVCVCVCTFAGERTLDKIPAAI